MKFNTGELVSNYVNNARIEVTSDNVFIDFGFADPFDKQQDPNDVQSKVLTRVVMNISTFQNFLSHINSSGQNIQAGPAPAGGAGAVILSRCPPGTSPKI